MRMKFTDIVEFSGKTCSTFDGKKNYISTGCVHDNHICKDEIETVEYINKPSRANLVVEPGDILFAKMQATKKTLLINEDLSQNIYSTGFYAVKPKDGLITKKCLFYLINSSLFLGEKDKNCSGATQKAINNQGLSSIELNIPEFSVQKLLTQKLDVLSKAIEVKQSQIRFFDNLIKARFVEMFGNYTMEKTIGEVATICRGASPRPISKFITKSNGENWIKIGDAKEDDIYITKTKELVTEDGANRSRRIKPGDFILSNSMSFGRPYISKIYGCVHDGWLIVSDYEQSFLPLFFYYAIRSELVQAQFRKSVAGAVVKNLNSDLVRSVKIVIPSIESQEKFSSFAKQIDKSKFAVQKSLEKTQLLFDSLMQEYFG